MPAVSVRHPKEQLPTTGTALRRSRFAAFMADGIITAVVLAIVLSIFGPSPRIKEWVPNWTPTIMATLSLWLFESVQAWLMSMYGQSLGKMLLQIRIARIENDGNAGFLRAVLIKRWLIGLLYLVPVLGRAFFFADGVLIFGKANRCIHDYIAGTHVVYANLPSTDEPLQRWPR